MLADWFETPKGSYVLAWERGQFDAAVEDVFGFNAVQLGLPGLDFLRESRIPLKVRAGLDPGCGLRSEPVQLPLASQSSDLLALPHVLEFIAKPHAILREAERVLMPEGSIVISGFNPLSLWGAARALGWERRQYPSCGRFIGSLRLLRTAILSRALARALRFHGESGRSLVADLRRSLRDPRDQAQPRHEAGQARVARQTRRQESPGAGD